LINWTIRKCASFLETSVKGGEGILVSNSLRQHYVPKVYNKQQADITVQLKEKKVAVIVDETTDIMGHYVVNVLMQSMDAFAGADYCRPFLVNTEFLEEVNNSTMAQVVIRTLSKLNINFNDALASLIGVNRHVFYSFYTTNVRTLPCNRMPWNMTYPGVEITVF